MRNMYFMSIVGSWHTAPNSPSPKPAKTFCMLMKWIVSGGSWKAFLASWLPTELTMWLEEGYCQPHSLNSRKEQDEAPQDAQRISIAQGFNHLCISNEASDSQSFPHCQTLGGDWPVAYLVGTLEYHTTHLMSQFGTPCLSVCIYSICGLFF